MISPNFSERKLIIKKMFWSIKFCFAEIKKVKQFIICDFKENSVEEENQLPETLDPELPEIPEIPELTEQVEPNTEVAGGVLQVLL